MMFATTMRWVTKEAKLLPLQSQKERNCWHYQGELMTSIFFLKSQNYFWSNATFTIIFFNIKKLIKQFFITVIKSDVNIGAKLKLINDLHLSYKICYEIIVKILWM